MSRDDADGATMCFRPGEVLRSASPPSPRQCKPPQWEKKRCGYCDDTGDVHSIDGEWRGRCTCPVGQSAPHPESVAQPAREAKSSYQLVGEVQTLHELNDSWIQHLPAGTLLYAKTRTNVGSDGLSDEDRAAMRYRLDACASSPPSDLACNWMPIESAPKDGTTLLLRSRKGRVADGCWVPVNGNKGYWAWALVNQEPAEWAPMLSATPPAQAVQDREDEAIYEVRNISFLSGYLTLKRINGDKEVPQSMESGMAVTLRAARTRGNGVEPS